MQPVTTATVTLGPLFAVSEAVLSDPAVMAKLSPEEKASAFVSATPEQKASVLLSMDPAEREAVAAAQSALAQVLPKPVRN